MKNNLLIYLLPIIVFLGGTQNCYSQSCTGVNAGTPGSSETCYDFDAASSGSGSSVCAGAGHGGSGSVRIVRFCTNASSSCVLFNFTGLSATDGTSFAIYTTCSAGSLSGYVSGTADCDGDNSTTIYTTAGMGLAANTCYYLRVWTKNAPSSSSSLCMSSINPPNDACSGAEGVDATPSSTDNYCTTSGPTTNSPTITPAMLCAGSLENTAWYSFTAVVTADIVMTLANFSCLGGGAGYQIGFFSGVCGSLSNFGCTSGSSGTVNVTITGVTAGQTIYVAIDGNAGANCTFDISATNTVPLPVKLLSFNPTIQDNKHVIVNWTTETETNNDYFTIERSKDLVNFEVIDVVKSTNGNSNVTQSYNLLDKNPIKGISYYRLKQTDYDGQFEYFKAVAVNVKQTYDDVVYPNPVSGNGYLTFSSLKDDEQTVVIYDVAGRLVYQKQYTITNGNNKLTLETNNLTKGMYFIKLDNAEDGINFKFIKE